MKPVVEVISSLTLSAESRNILQSALAKQSCSIASDLEDVTWQIPVNRFPLQFPFHPVFSIKTFDTLEIIENNRMSFIV
jgi:hypothetical protein